MQTLMIVIILGMMFVLFSVFADEYYFNQKMRMIKNAFNILAKEDISTISSENRMILSFEEQKLRFIICDENFEPIYITTKKRIRVPLMLK